MFKAAFGRSGTPGLTPGHVWIQQNGNAFEICASERPVNAADDFKISLFAHNDPPGGG